jgi:undecaprenyl-phosphate 4-deoxy-4-formamido-L-arabinose transferase
VSTESQREAVELSVVVPCFLDEVTLPALFARITPVFESLDGDAELVIVDDGSPDRTAEVALDLASRAPYPTTVVQLLRNFGQHAAVFAGFAEARGRVVVTMDSDLQYPPEQIPVLVSALSPQYPVVSGARETRRDPAPRRVITRLLGMWLRRQTGTTLRDFGSMFRAYDRSVVDRLLEFREQRRFVPALVAWLGVPVKELPIVHEPRGEAGTRYRFGALVDMVLDLVTGYSIFPLRLVVFLALLGSGVGFVATMGFVIYRLAIGAGIARQVSAYALLFFLLGIQLLMLALLGEYAGRIYTEVKRRPYYIVREATRRG